MKLGVLEEILSILTFTMDQETIQLTEEKGLIDTKTMNPIYHLCEVYKSLEEKIGSSPKNDKLINKFLIL